jgi:cytoskeletal protein CcmA (bactofilin family)
MLLTDTKDTKADAASTDDSAMAPAAQAVPKAARPATPGGPMVRPAAPDAPAQPHGQQLIVGQGISLTGEIAACDKLMVEGTVKVALTKTRAIEIADTGRFTDGKAEVEEAVIGGVYEGELTVRGRLLIRSSGRVDGTIRYRDLEIERGGRIAGSLHALDAPD